MSATRPTLATKCYNCEKPKEACEKLSRCAACSLITYCSKDCQTAHWETHKAFCKAVRKAPAMFRSPPDVYEEFGFRKYAVHVATKEASTEVERDSIEASLVRDMIIANFAAFLEKKEVSFECLQFLMETVSLSTAKTIPNKAVAFMACRDALRTLLQYAYAVMRTGRTILPLRNCVRDIWRLVDQMLRDESAGLILGHQLELDLQEGTPQSLLDVIVAFMTEFDGVADDIEGLAWQSVALVAIHVERSGASSKLVEGVFERLVRAGRNRNEVKRMFEFAKMQSVQFMMSA